MKPLRQQDVVKMIKNDCEFCDGCGDVVIIGNYIRQSFFLGDGRLLCPDCYLSGDYQEVEEQEDFE